MEQKFSRATRWIVNRRWLTVLVLLVISCISVGGYVAPYELVQWLKSFSQRTQATQEAAPVHQPWAENDYTPPPEVDAIKVSGFDALVVVESDSLFTPTGVTAMRDVVAEVRKLDYVEDVLWVDEVPTLNIFGLNEPLLPKEHAAPERFVNAREKIKQHPLVNGQLISADGRTLILLLDIDYFFVQSDQVFLSEIRETAEAAAAKHDIKMQFWVTGKAPVYLAVMQAHEANQLKYQAIAYALIVILSMILFRGAIAVGVVVLAPAFGVFWTMGLIRYLDFQLNPFNDVVLPILVALVGFTDGVHLMVQIRRERAAGLGPLAAAKEGLRKVGLACFLTSLTTAVGFGSLALAHHQFVREFGYCCTIGVMLSFLAVILTIPLACSTWLGRRVHVGHGTGMIDQNINRVSVVIDLVLEHKRWVSFIAMAISLVCFLTSMTLGPDQKQADVLSQSSEQAIALAKLDSALGGLEQARINVVWDRTVEKGGGTELLSVLGELDTLLAKEELVGHPLSIYNLLAALPGDGPVIGRASMLDLLPPRLKRGYYSPEDRRASVEFRVQNLGIARYAPVFEQIETGIQEISESHPGFQLELSGDAVSRWQNIFQIVMDLATSLGTAAIIIFFILAIVYRSVRIGIISILPNLFPLCVAGTYLVLTEQSLEIVTVCAFTCCLGIAVDDTIHFLTRYMEEKEKTDDEAEAIRRAFTEVGTALIMTTLVLVAGFLTVLTSETREHRIFASMGAITVAAALFGDLVFLPALLATFPGKKKSKVD